MKRPNQTKTNKTTPPKTTTKKSPQNKTEITQKKQTNQNHTHSNVICGPKIGYWIKEGMVALKSVVRKLINFNIEIYHVNGLEDLILLRC